MSSSDQHPSSTSSAGEPEGAPSTVRRRTVLGGTAAGVLAAAGYAAAPASAATGSGIEQGSISLHPSGFTHGPQPGAVERSLGADFFDELAVMVDTFRPLDLCDAASACEDSGYAWTWARRA